MSATVAFAPGAEHNALAQWLAQRVDAAVERGRRSDLRVLRAAVCVVAPDKRLSATLRFDHGLVTVHDGMLGVPDVTFCADLPELEALATLGTGGDSLGKLRRSATDWLGGQVKIYGWLSHPRLVARVLRLLAAGA